MSDLELAQAPTAELDFTAQLPDLVDSRKAVIHYLTGLDSESSRRTLRKCLDRVAGMVAPGATAHDLRWTALEPEHVGLIRAAVERQTTLKGGQPQAWSPAYRNNHMAALRGVVDAAHTLGFMSSDRKDRALKAAKNFRGVRLPKGRLVAVDELERLLASCLKPATSGGAPALVGLRDAAMFSVMYFCGLRREEIGTVRIECFTGGDQRELRVIGKGDKERLVTLHPVAARLVETWLSAYEAHLKQRKAAYDEAAKAGKKLPKAKPFAYTSVLALFPPIHKSGSVQPKHLTPAAVLYLVNVRRVAVGLTPMSPHDFRRSAISSWLTVTDPAMASRLAGHANVSTTLLYDLRSQQAARDAVDRLPAPSVPFLDDGQPAA